jgi:hypothetical protein
MLRLLFVLPLLLLGCHSQPSSSATPPAILAEWSGQHSGVNTASTQIVSDAAAWSALWQQIGREPPHAFDPSRETAVAIFLGQRRTGGYRVEFAGLQREADQLVLNYREEKPAPGAMVTQVISSPWAVAIISSVNQPIATRQPPPATPLR